MPQARHPVDSDGPAWGKSHGAQGHLADGDPPGVGIPFHQTGGLV